MFVFDSGLSVWELTKLHMHDGFHGKSGNNDVVLLTLTFIYCSLVFVSVEYHIDYIIH